MKLRSIWHFNPAAYFALDYAMLWAATVCAFKLSPSYQNEVLVGPFLNDELFTIGYGMPLLMALGLFVADLQRPRAGLRFLELVIRVLFALAVGVLVFATLHAVITFVLVGRYIIIFSLVFGTAFIAASRALLWKLAAHGSRNVILYGGAAMHQALTDMVRRFDVPIRMVGYRNLASLMPATPRADWIVSLRDECFASDVDEIVVDVPDTLTPDERRALSHCARAGIPVADLTVFFERSFEQVYIEGLRESWFWSYDPIHTQPWYFAFKRFCDLALSTAGLMACAPIIPLIALAIKLQDRGPIFYSQLRLGRYGQPFKIFKIRTMRIDAELNGAQWAGPNDTRVTWLGRYLRRTRLDEVPQFWNILLGDMSFIGPRPERPEFVEQIEGALPFYGYRHLLKPGLSGWAQVNYPYGASIEDARRKLAYDLYYLKHASAVMDLLIVFRTIAAMVKGAR